MYNLASSCLEVLLISSIILLIGSWLYQSGPIMALQYAIPLGIILLAVVLREATISWKDFGLIVTFGLAVAVHSFFYADTSPINPLLGLLTYSSLLIITLRFGRPAKVLLAVAIVVAGLSIFEFLIGVAQIFAKFGTLIFPIQAAGDAVTGTLANNARVFHMKMFIQAIFLFYVWLDRSRYLDLKGWWRYWVLAGAICGIVGSVLTGAVAIMALGIAALLVWHIAWLVAGPVEDRGQRLRDLSAVSLFLAGGLLVFFVTQPSNVSKLRNYLSREDTSTVQPPSARNDETSDTNDEGETEEQALKSDTVDGRGDIGPVVFGSQKLGVFFESINEVLLEDPRTALIGVGLGRYSSRAALMLTGGYLMPRDPDRQPDWMPVSRTELTDEYIYRRWLMRNKIYPNPSSSLHDPFSSAQSVLLEFGIIGTVMLVGYLTWTLKRTLRNASQSSSGHALFLSARLPAIYLVVLVSSFYELWLEWPQMIALVYLLSALGLSKESAQ